MTEHTPTTADIRNAVTRDESDWRVAGAQFDRWLASIEAAAEQRGAEEGWDLAIDYAWDDSSIYEADAKRAKAANPYRADQEGDDE